MKSTRLAKRYLKTHQQFRLQISLFADTICNIDVQTQLSAMPSLQQVTSPLAAHGLRATRLQQLHMHNCMGENMDTVLQLADPSENSSFS